MPESDLGSYAWRERSVSRETRERLDIYEGLLLKWSKVKNLVGPSTLGDIWERHFRDCLQLRMIAPNAMKWVDLGSGAGLPGLVIAASLAESPGAVVHLIESDGRKCAFLREAIRATNVPARVHHGRIEDVLRSFPQVEVVTARALAPMKQLIAFSASLLKGGAEGLFLKGQDYSAELTDLGRDDRFDINVIPSVTDPRSRIVRVIAKSPYSTDQRSAQ